MSFSSLVVHHFSMNASKKRKLAKEFVEFLEEVEEIYKNKYLIKLWIKGGATVSVLESSKYVLIYKNMK